MYNVCLCVSVIVDVDQCRGQENRIENRTLDEGLYDIFLVLRHTYKQTPATCTVVKRAEIKPKVGRPETVNAVMTEGMLRDIGTRCRHMMLMHL